MPGVGEYVKMKFKPRPRLHLVFPLLAGSDRLPAGREAGPGEPEEGPGETNQDAGVRSEAGEVRSFYQGHIFHMQTL